MLSLTSRRVSSSTMSFASRSDRARQSSFGHDQGVPGPAGGQRFPESRHCPVGAGQPLVGERLLRRHPKSGQGILLRGEVLAVGGYAGLSDEESGHGVECTV